MEGAQYYSTAQQQQRDIQDTVCTVGMYCSCDKIRYCKEGTALLTTTAKGKILYACSGYQISLFTCCCEFYSQQEADKQ